MSVINITFQDLAPLLKTGDIVLYHGDSSFQEVIDIITASTYNHMSMVVLSKDIGLSSPTPEILLWESTPYAMTQDQELHYPKAGPTLVDMQTRMTQEVQKGMFLTIIVRRLANPVNAQSLSGLQNAIKTALPDKFPSDFWFFAKGIIGRLFNKEVQPATFFCSELVAYTYQQMGLLDTSHPPDYFLPKNFSSQGQINLLQNQSFGDDYNIELSLKK